MTQAQDTRAAGQTAFDSAGPSATQAISALPVPLDRDQFMRSMLRELAGTLEDVVGLDEAAGFISVVGQHIGDQINADYRQALQTPQLDQAQVAAVLVDLKRRIHGDFEVLERDERRIVLGNRACPFGDKVLGRPSMCMMTSNVFGVIAAENLGQARVVLDKTIARGDGHCRVVVELQDVAPAEGQPQARTYYRT